MKRAPVPRGARRYRLTGVGAFEAVFRDGRRRDGDYLELVAVPAPRSPGRAGLVVSRKALPLAVDRNRIRRILREALRHARPAIEAYDVVLRLKRPCPRCGSSCLAAEAQTLLDGLIVEGRTR